MRHALLVLALLAAPPAVAAQCPSHGAAMARTELLFGAGHVSDAQWNAFLAHEVTPRFPDGLTAFDGYGQWKPPRGAISKERSHVLLLWHAVGADADARIDAIRSAYKKRFRQRSVMRVDNIDCVSF
ncbi:MAG: DUF3574 domain-containing protein [Proteobacteria bacterium]|nr:DUF3574 domain-containing protein [Pseudomonadota bacterium]